MGRSRVYCYRRLRRLSADCRIGSQEIQQMPSSPGVSETDVPKDQVEQECHSVLLKVIVATL